ncbi:PDR/VanB family oxidoreductase [Tateyamaria omphalii]|uniref:PDR/VanB family oxidoreductase n=1 Tax=Tateyamaria omphalii TaxID=299262 RepID=UPI0021BD7A3E|nr:PDR/VanB family oxidoreductase [Tateyamaria omphalii]
MTALRLTEIVDETPRIRVFRFQSADGARLPAYEAGAHVEFDLGVAGQRSYSLIDWPNSQTGPRQDYVVAVQREDEGAGGSKAMHALDVGAVVDASAPANDFPLDVTDAPVLLLAGGIGITPMISMATALSKTTRCFALHYTGRSAAAMGFVSALTTAFKEQTVFHFDDVEPLDLDDLMTTQPQNTALYICGPSGMISAARRAAEAAGLTHINVELFAPHDMKTDDTDFEVEINDGRVFQVPVGRTIIEVLEAAGVDVMYDCQRGDCGICQCDVLSGTPDHRDVVLSEEERLAGKVMQICVSRATSKRLVLDI